MKSRLFTSVLVCLLIVLVLAACSSVSTIEEVSLGAHPTGTDIDEGPERAIETNSDPLSNTRWLLVSFSSSELKSKKDITMEFRDGFMVTRVCNNLVTHYIVKGDRLFVADPSSTLMLCEPEEIMQDEDMIYGVIGKLNRFEIDGDQLYLYQDDNIMLIYERAK